MIVRYFASEWCMTSLFQKGKIYERWSFSFSSAVGSCTTNPPSSPFGFDNVGWKILPGGCRFSGGEMTGKFRKVASHYAPEPAFLSAGKGQFCSGLCNGSIKGNGKLYQQRKVYRKNETVWMECKLVRETEAHHFSEPGWEEGARQQSVKNISSGYQQGGLRE